MGKKVRLIIESVIPLEPTISPEESFELLTHIYDGLTEEEIDRIEEIIIYGGTEAYHEERRREVAEETGEAPDEYKN